MWQRLIRGRDRRAGVTRRAIDMERLGGGVGGGGELEIEGNVYVMFYRMGNG